MEIVMNGIYKSTKLLKLNESFRKVGEEYFLYSSVSGYFPVPTGSKYIIKEIGVNNLITMERYVKNKQNGTIVAIMIPIDVVESNFKFIRTELTEVEEEKSNVIEKIEAESLKSDIDFRKVDTLYTDWFFTTEVGEEFRRFKVGEKSGSPYDNKVVKTMNYYNNGNLPYVDIIFEDGSEIRMFNLNEVRFEVE